MSLSWPAIPFAGGNVDGEPVRGSASEVESVVTMFDRMRTAAEEICRQFGIIKDEGADSEDLRGDSGDKFREIVDKVNGSLGDLPGVADSAYTVLNEHLSRLEDLKSAASTALVRRNTRWDAVVQARGAASSAASANERLQAQVNSLPPPGADPVADGDRAGAETAASDSAAARATAQSNLGDAEDDLAASKTEWGDLRGDEDELNESTASRLDDISLWRPRRPELVGEPPRGGVRPAHGSHAARRDLRAHRGHRQRRLGGGTVDAPGHPRHGADDRRRDRPVHADRASSVGPVGRLPSHDGDPVRHPVAKPRDRSHRRSARRRAGRDRRPPAVASSRPSAPRPHPPAP